MTGGRRADARQVAQVAFLHILYVLVVGPLFQDSEEYVW